MLSHSGHQAVYLLLKAHENKWDPSCDICKLTLAAELNQFAVDEDCDDGNEGDENGTDEVDDDADADDEVEAGAGLSEYDSLSWICLLPGSPQPTPAGPLLPPNSFKSPLMSFLSHCVA